MKEIIILAAFTIMLILFILINIERTKEKRQEEEKERSQVDKLIGVIKEYAKDQPRLLEIMNKMGML